MKKLLSLLFAAVLAIGTLHAQDFNGKITYGFDIAGEGAEQVKAFMPESMSMTFLKTDMIMEMKGGMVAMMMGKILVQGKKGKAYMIKDAEETIYVMNKPDEEDEDGEEDAKPTVTATGETETIAGYECAKYEIVTETPEGPVTSYAWSTEKIKPAKGKSDGGVSGMGMSAMSVEGLPGMPLRMETAQGPFTIIFEAKEVDTTTPDKALFKLPKGYDKEDFDPAMFGGGGGGMGY